MRTILSGPDAHLTSGTPYWPERTSKQRKYTSLRQNATCDVAVVGGGITGALIAHRMCQAGLETVLVDKGRFGSGSTSASTALISYEFDLMLSELTERHGEKAAVRAYELSFEATKRLKDLVRDLEDPCDYEEKSSIRITNRAEDLQLLEKETRVRNRNGMSVKLLDGPTLQSRFGISASYGLVSSNAAQIDPLSLSRMLISRAIQHGLKAFEQTKVTAHELDGRQQVLTTADGASIRANHVCFATGYGAEKYLGKSKTQRSTDFCFVCRPDPGLGKLEKCHVVENKDNYLYLSTFGDRVMVGMEGKAFLYPGERSRLLPRRERQLRDRVSAILPGLELEVAYRWASTFVDSTDSLPYIGRLPRFPGAIFALGYGGNGIASSCMLSSIVVDLFTKGSSPEEAVFSLDR